MTATSRLIALAVCVCVICAGTAAGAAQPQPATEPSAVIVHQERPDQPPVPRDRATAPRSRPTLVRRNGYVSVQVNVDAEGNNIIGDAANEPSLAVDPTDPERIVIGWRQFDSVMSNFRQGGWAYSQDGGQTWTFPGVLQPGVFRSDPVLNVSAEGIFYYFSLQQTYQLDLYISTDGGQTWQPPVPAYGGDKEWLTVDRTSSIGHGNIYGVWQANYNCCGQSATFTRSTDGGMTFEYPVAVPDAISFGTMAVGPDGEVYVAGVRGYGGISFSSFRVAKSTNAKNPSQTPTFTKRNVSLGGSMAIEPWPNPAGLMSQACIAVDQSSTSTRGYVYLVCGVVTGGNPSDLNLIRSTNGGTSWSAPIRINDDPLDSPAWQWFGVVSVAPNGRVDVIWNDTRSVPHASPNHSELYYAYSNNGGVTWSRNVALTPPFNHFAGYPQQNKLGDYYDMVSDEAGARVAYAATFNGEEDVYFLRIGDCNENGVHDGTDISAGTSLDCNSNAVPDECELADGDCNVNGVPDDCDIAAGSSLDCNGNLTPDECELATHDCNSNGVPDDCDIAAGTSVDCNNNGVPDTCDIALDTSADCNANSIPDECDIGSGTSADCNTNGLPDECELAAGTATDCNNNGCLDECDLSTQVGYDSPPFTPLGLGFPQTYVLPAPRLATGPVNFTFLAHADINFTTEYIDLYLNGTWVDVVFGEDVVTNDCAVPPDQDQVTVSAAVWNAAAGTGTVQIQMLPTDNMDPYYCADPTWISVAVRYESTPLSPDCNANALPDECDLAAGTSADCNSNGVPDECDIAGGTSQDVNGDGIPDECAPATGACCSTTGSCSVTAQAACDGTWLGAATECDPNPCPQPWCHGDLNCSGGSPTFDDIKYFSAAIGSESSWWAYYRSNNGGADPPCYWLLGDYNTPRNGVEFSDIKPFAASIGQPCIPYVP